MPTHRVCYLVSHPIQYQAPLLRRIAEDPDIELMVLFETLATASAYRDDGFGRDVAWDVPLTEGYRHREVSDTDGLRQQLTESDVLWLHGWDSKLKRRSLFLAQELRVPVLMRGENTMVAMPDGAGLRGMVKRHYLKSIFKHCAGFLCIGTENRRYFEAHGIDDARLFSMPYAVDNVFFANCAAEAAERREDFRRELGLSPDRAVVLFAGKLQARKHPQTLLKAWRKLVEGNSASPYLVYVGDGEEREGLEAEAGDDERIKMLGFRNQTELPALYDMADVFVLASEREPWGLAVNEAMACGTAVVVSDQCGCAVDLVSDDCGAVVASGDVDALASALRQLTSDVDNLKVLGCAAHQRISAWGFDEDIAGMKAALNAVCPVPGTT